MIRTYNPNTRRYENDPIKDLRKPAITPVNTKVDALEKEVEVLKELLAQASQCRSITQVRKLLAS